MTELKPYTPMKALRDYFGTLPEYKGEKGLKGFMAEVKELSPKDKNELVDLAIKELGGKLVKTTT
tara:strand:+ start:4616 stop:4810 length:195 start_codon:yes stop_codon:yes gene_type:complete